MRDLKYQAEKKARQKTNQKTVVSAKYHNLLDIFFNKNLNIVPSYQKYYYKIILEKNQKYCHIPIYKMLPQELDTIKYYLDLYLTKV